MIRAIDLETKQYCHYQGYGTWTLNQRHGEPEPESKIVAATWYETRGDNGEAGIVLNSSSCGNRLSVDGHIVINEAYKPITKDVDIIDDDVPTEIKLRIKGLSSFTLEILNTSVEPPVSKKIKIERFVLPELELSTHWPEIDGILRRHIGQ
jgi:hypothetical protein